MAENESLDLDSHSGQRWNKFVDAVRKGAPPEKAAEIACTTFRRRQSLAVAGVKERDGWPVPDRVVRHLRGTGVVVDDEGMRDALFVLQTYRDEWIDLISKARDRGMGWARLFFTSSGKKAGAVSGIA
jgi:hypothetical protein